MVCFGEKFSLNCKTNYSFVPLFVSQTAESVLSALSGCKILRELSKLENETETKVSMKELAQNFENLAHGMSVIIMFFFFFAQSNDILLI